jgi:cellulose synthase/poly-beta-1,6-N-acetylglucosamine synthase-like glycosyltransferase
MVSNNATVAALVPAHNEEDQIGDAVLALLRQTRPLDLILVVADNCTDGTVDVVRQIQRSHPTVVLLETIGNATRKAGALNQGLHHLGGRFEFVLQQDADSVLDHRFLAAALDELAADPRIGGCSGRYQAKAYAGLGGAACFLWQLQRMDYLRYDSMRMESPRNPAVLSGTGSLFRADALGAVGGWDEASLVEDFSMTLDLKGAGWGVAVARRAYTRTDVPLTVAALWRQRMRWQRGTVDELRKRGWAPHTRADIATQALLMFLLLAQILFLASVAVAAFLVHEIHWNPWFLVVPAVVTADRLYRLRYYPDLRVRDVVMTVLPVEDMFNVFKQCYFTSAYVKSLRFADQSW